MRTALCLTLAMWIGLFSMEAFPAYADGMDKGATKGAEDSAEKSFDGMFSEGRKETGKDIFHLPGRDGNGEAGNYMLIPGGEPFGVRFFTDGALIYRVEEGSPASAAGLVPGDLICTVDEQKVNNAAELMYILEKTPSGKKLSIDYVRDGKTIIFYLRPPPRRRAERQRHFGACVTF